MSQNIELTLQKIYDLFSRLDERMKIIVEKNNNNEEKINDFRDQFNETILQIRRELLTISAEESFEKIKELEKRQNSFESEITKLKENNDIKKRNWVSAFDFVSRIIWTIITAYLLYKLGLQPPI
jgi:hypothetical protein